MSVSPTTPSQWCGSQSPAVVTGSTNRRPSGPPHQSIRSPRSKGDEFSLDFTTDIGGVEGALAIYNDSLLDYVIENIVRNVDEEDVEEGLDVPIVGTGGTSSPNGFEALFEERLEEAWIPLSISGVTRASDPMYGVAPGALVAARS